MSESTPQNKDISYNNKVVIGNGSYHHI